MHQMCLYECAAASSEYTLYFTLETVLGWSCAEGDGGGGGVMAVVAVESLNASLNVRCCRCREGTR